MNIKLLRKVKRHILAEPKRLLMGDWIQDKSALNKKVLYGPGESKERPFAKCGTAACIAGWAVRLAGNPETVNRFAVEEEATGLLDLTVYEAERLFFPEDWPEEFLDGLSGDGKKKTAEVAAARIEHFIKTEGRK